MTQPDCTEDQAAVVRRLSAEIERLLATLNGIVARYDTAEDGWPAEDMREMARHALDETGK